MKRRCLIIAVALVILAVTAVNFGPRYVGVMSRDVLAATVARDTIVFGNDLVSRSVLDILGKNKVVVVGEYHNISEHAALLRQLSTALHQTQGFSHLLLETPQAFSWIFTDYSLGIMPEVDEQTARRFWFYIGELKGIREYNLSLPLEQRLQVSTIDINHSPFAFVMSLEYMLEFVDNRELLVNVCRGLREAIRDNGQYVQRVEEFKRDLALNAAAYKEEVGEVFYQRLVRMTDVELESSDIRAAANNIFSRKKDNLREAMIKSLVDEHIREAAGKVLINVGANHAQKSPARGTVAEWLGEYLAYKSPDAQGQTYCLLVVPAQGTVESGSGGMSIDLARGPENELFRSIAEQAGAQRGFLSLADMQFAEKRALMNFHYDQKSLRPKQLYDGVLVLPVGTYVNPFPE